jgi:ketosteroid isomerase-like protein
MLSHAKLFCKAWKQASDIRRRDEDLGPDGLRAGAAERSHLFQDALVSYASGMTESNGSTSTVDVFSALIADWNQAVVANDPNAIAAFAEPDWVFVGDNGIFPGEQFLEAVATGQVSHDFMTSDVRDVRVYGDVAIVIARVRNRGEFEGNPFTLDEWSTDVFVRRGDRWRCSVTHLTSVAATTPAA